MAKNLVLWAIIAAVLMTVFNNFQNVNHSTELKYSDFINSVDSGQVERVTISGQNIDGLLTNGESFTTVIPADPVLLQMVKLYEKYQCSIVAIEEVPADQTYKYGVIGGNEEKPGVFRIQQMVEKPDPEDAPSNLAIIGRYILTPDIFDILRETPPGRNGELQITDALMSQAEHGRVIGYQFKGQRFDCGSVEGFVEATNYCFENYYKNGK